MILSVKTAILFAGTTYDLEVIQSPHTLYVLNASMLVITPSLTGAEL